jgi:hypothetical protein
MTILTVQLIPSDGGLWNNWQMQQKYKVEWMGRVGYPGY